MFIAILTILIGALLTAGGVQELVVQGILNNRLFPLVGGTLGTVAGALVLAAGIALLRASPLTMVLARAAAYVCIPVYILIGFITPLAGWPARIVGIAFPVFLLVYLQKQTAKTSK
jgi:hypothetical protein